MSLHAARSRQWYLAKEGLGCKDCDLLRCMRGLYGLYRDLHRRDKNKLTVTADQGTCYLR